MIYPKEKKAPGWKNYRDCSIGISLQSRNHVGECMEAIVEWTNGKFDNCIVDLSDTLHRYNYMIEEGLMPEQAREKAQAEGDRWLEEHKPVLDKLSMPYRVIRWEKWMDHPLLKEYKASFWQAFDSNPEFKQAVMEDVSIYYSRRHSLEIGEVAKEHLELSISYLLEEMAVHSIMFKNYSCASIYPGRQQACYKMVREGLVDGIPKGLQNSYFVPLFLYHIEDDKEQKDTGLNIAA